MCQDLYIQLTDVLKNKFIFALDPNLKFGHFGHFDFGHKSTQNPGAMPQPPWTRPDAGTRVLLIVRA